MRTTLSFSAVTLSLTGSLLAQIPAPAPEARVAPRAEYVLTQGVIGTPPANRHWSPTANNSTSMFVFGGRTGTSGTGTKRNDLYEFDGTTLSWILHNADGDPAAPQQRYRNTLTWDPLANRLIMFGGEDGVGTLLADTWQWDAATNTWTDISPAFSPSARRLTSAAYDPFTTGIIMFGGDDGSGNVLADTWLFVGNSWAQLSPATTPPARNNHHLITRPDFGDVFMCSGNDNLATGRTHHLDTWVWSGPVSDWVEIIPTTPAVLHGFAGHELAYDEVRKVVIMTGGNGISNSATQTGGVYGTAYGGSPSNWTSEFDCLTNEWRLRGAAAFSTGDPVIGRASRYYTAFLSAVGKTFFWGGQNPSGVGASLTAMKEYQATPVASAASYGAGCNGLSLTANNDPWLGRSWSATATGLTPIGLAFGVLGFSQVSVPVGGTCNVLVSQDSVSFLVNSGGSATMALGLPMNPAFVGIALNAQIVELSGPSIFASNGLALTLGSL